MKKHIIILIVLVISFLANAQNTVTIKGHITNAKSKIVFVKYYKDYLSFDVGVLGSSAVDDKGNFSITFNWTKPFTASFETDEEVGNLYLFPGDDLTITVDEKEFDKSLKYKGTGADVNNYITQKTLRMMDARAIKSASYKTMEEKAFTLYTDSLNADNVLFFTKYFSSIKNKTKAVNEYMEYETNSLKQEWIEDKMSYPGYYAYYNKLKERVKMSEHYYDFLKEFNINDVKAMSSYIFMRNVESYMYYELGKVTAKDSTLREKEKFAKLQDGFIETRLTGEVKAAFIASKAYNLIAHENNLETGKKMIDKYMAVSKSKEYLEVLNEAYAKASKLSSGMPAPDFTYADALGKMVSLKDFRGKIIYMDVWATWCGPCRREIPFAKKLEEEMKGKDVVFLSISVDKDIEAWKKLIMKEEMGGVHLISTGDFESDIAKQYNIKGIPRYIIIDKEGKMIDADAARPSGDAKEVLEKLLK